MKYFSLVDKKILLLAMGFLAFLGVATKATASEVISGSEIKKKINSFLIKKDLFGAPAISETRSFPACSSDILIRPMFGGLKTVEIFCSDPGGMKIAVRTNAVRIAEENIGSKVESSLNDRLQKGLNVKSLASSNAERGEPLSKKFLILSRSVQRGQILTARDVVLKNTSGYNIKGYFTKSSDVVGRKVKQTLSINRVLLNRHLEIDWDIRKGQK